jgi:hypothetical protein
MITVETIADISAERSLTLDLPTSVQPGRHRVLVVIDEAPISHSHEPNRPLSLNKLEIAGWPPSSTFARQDIYGDCGR